MAPSRRWNGYVLLMEYFTAPASSVLIVPYRGLAACHNRQASWALPNSGIRLYVPVRHSWITRYKSYHPLSQVGPVLDKFELGGVPYEGQYIVAGFSGHGMPRAFGWFVYSFLFMYPDDRTSQRGRRGSYDRLRDHGPRMGATAVAPATLSYELRTYQSALRLESSHAPPPKWRGSNSLSNRIYRIILLIQIFTS